MDLVVRPIGFARSPFVEKAQAPRQASVLPSTRATIEILPEHEDALSDLDGFDRIWVIFWFHLAFDPASADAPRRGKVLPPRSTARRGVFATRTPHRPNPIGLSSVRLVRVEGRVLHIEGVDLVDGTPVLDIKPYIPYADAFPEARAGWLDEPCDPIATWSVRFAPEADERLAFLKENGADLRDRITSSLAVGPQPHAYRRIRKEDDESSVLAVKDWRVRFRVDGERSIAVTSVFSGYRPQELTTGTEPAHAVHRAFVARFG